MKKVLHCFVCLFTSFVIHQQLAAQTMKLRGTIYDYFSKKPLDAVTIRTVSGSNTISDSTGKFIIPVTTKDSIWFSYFSKNTIKYPVDTIRDLSNFEIALYVDVAWLPEVRVRNSNYKLDSIQNRNEYAKVFNFKKPGLSINSSSPSTYVPGSVTAGLDLDELINMFRFKRNRQLLTMQNRLIQQEEEKYVNHRFTKFLVSQLTSLKGNTLDSFMTLSKPSYELLITMNDLELGYYIQQFYAIFQKNNRLNDSLQKENN